MHSTSDMRWNVSARILVAAGFAAGVTLSSRSEPSVILRTHSAGMSHLASQAELATVQQLLNLPESRRLTERVVERLAASLPAVFGFPGSGPTNRVPALVPLTQALIRHESVLEVRAEGDRVTAWALALRPDDAPARTGDGLRQFLSEHAGAGSSAPKDVPGGWEWAGGPRTTSVRFEVAGRWALFGSGTGPLEALRDSIRKQGTPVAGPTSYLLRTEADLGRLARLLDWPEVPAAPVPQWPQVQVTVEPRNGRLRTSAQMEFPRPLGLQLEPWEIPNSQLHDPLVGFTAIQGADSWLGNLDFFAPLQVSTWPRQFFLWSVAGDPWNQYFAGPVAQPTNLIAKVAYALPYQMVTNMSWQGQLFGIHSTNQGAKIMFMGLPYGIPFMEAIRQGDREMVYGGLIPQPPRALPAPEPLLRQVVGRTNLVLYDWETTGRSVLVTNPPGTAGPRVTTNALGRLVQLKHLSQYSRLMMSTNAGKVIFSRSGEVWVPGGPWVTEAYPSLGDSITEVTVTGPRQLTLVRQSELGFNAFELTHLLRWIENAGFPGWSGTWPAPAGMLTLPTPPTPKP